MGQCCGGRPNYGRFVEMCDQRVKETFQESEIIDKEIFWANLRHQRSSGGRQVMGNGAFVLTSEVVWFGLLMPDKRITIPLRNIRAVCKRMQSGSSQKNLFLVVDFVNDVSGIEDQVVIAIREPDHWIRLINEAISKAT